MAAMRLLLLLAGLAAFGAQASLRRSQQPLAPGGIPDADLGPPPSQVDPSSRVRSIKHESELMGMEWPIDGSEGDKGTSMPPPQTAWQQLGDKSGVHMGSTATMEQQMGAIYQGIPYAT